MNWILIFCTILCLGECVTDRDLYEILGITPSATQSDIKSSYKKLARKYHPDVNPGQDAQEMFQEIAYAKEILTDEHKRNIYDQYGHDGLAQMGDQNSGHGTHPFGDMFGQMFGQQQEEIPKGDDIVTPLMVNLEELFSGSIISLTKTEKVVRDAAGFRECNCRVEMKTVQVGPGQFNMHQEKVCEECPNIKLVDEDVDIDVTIEPGMHHGDLVRYPGQGELEIDGDNGDLIVGIHLLEHKTFHRKQNDLYSNVTISLKDALLGFETEIIHLNGETIKISRKGITWNGFKQRLLGRGMPIRNTDNLYKEENKKEKGALIITFDIAYPDAEFSDEDRELINIIFNKLNQQKPRAYNGL